MHLHILLDKPPTASGAFTSYTPITGRVQAYLSAPATTISIDVECAAVSASQLPNLKSASNSQEETHTLFQMSHRLWGFHQGDANLKGHYTMKEGNYDWPFHFSLPGRMDCAAHESRIGGLLDRARRKKQRHVDGPLPPSLSGMPEFAGVVYYVKVVVRTKDVFAKDPTVWQGFTFSPGEPLRDKDRDGVRFARQHYRVGESTDDAQSQIPANVKVEARLPHSGAVTLGQTLPLSLMVERLASEGGFWLQNLTVHLVGHTQVRVGEAMETKTIAWKLVDHRGDQVASPRNEKGSVSGEPPKYFEEVLDIQVADYWPSIVPHDVAPSFEVCNVKRWYDIDIVVSLSRQGHTGKEGATTIPLRLACDVRSGVSQGYKSAPMTAMDDIGFHPQQEQHKVSEHPPEYENEVQPPAHMEGDVYYRSMSAATLSDDTLQDEKR